MDIKPPYGYQDIVPLTKQHRVLLPEARKLPTVFRSLTALPLSFTEFGAACRDYPIAFIGGEGGRAFVAMAVLGLESQQNLFVTAEGGWDPAVYLPAYVRRYPFCMARVPNREGAETTHMICVEREWLDEQNGQPMFDAAGKPAERWGTIERLLSEYEADLARTREMCSVLADYSLLETFTMQASLPAEKGGGTMQLTGMHRVDEKKLENLNAAQLKNLMRKGILARIYLHLLSLENFSRLLERKATSFAKPA